MSNLNDDHKEPLRSPLAGGLLMYGGFKRRAYRYITYIYHSSKLRIRLRNYEAPLNPFKIISVPPSCVEQFTGRPYPPWLNAQGLLGSVRSGKWDITQPTVSANDYSGTPAHLYLGKTFSESIVHQSLKNHFTHDIPWTETRIVRESLQLVDDRRLVWNCSSEQEIFERCNRLDQMYSNIKRDGALDVERAEKARGALPSSILDQLANNILVDISRNGRLLFVDGRHRLSIAKILELDRIPVAVCVRHKKWMDHRDEVYLSDEPIAHPDFAEWEDYENVRSSPLLSD